MGKYVETNYDEIKCIQSLNNRNYSESKYLTKETRKRTQLN